jgi:tRNA(Ile)-lysidine synthase
VSKDHIGIVSSSVRAVLETTGARGARILVALSGGVDSVVLLHCLTRLAPELDLHLSALHVHHGLSRNADAWAQFCDQLCSQMGVPCITVRVRVDRRHRLGLEAAAREARYAQFRTQQADAIALAHHRDDQAETLLLQLLRGAGVRGLSAMPQMRALDACGSLRMLRPMLDVTRSQILAYAREAGLAWVEDESNADPAMDRNFLRLQVMPLLLQRFPAAVETLCRTAENAADASALLDELAALDARSAVTHSGLEVEALARSSEPRARNLLRWFLEREGVPLPGRDRLEEALHQIVHARRDARVEVQLGLASLRRHRGRICVEAIKRDAPADWSCTWHGEARIGLPDGLGTMQFEQAVGAGLSVQRLRERPIVIRPRAGGERMRLAHGRPSRTLKNLLQEAAMPHWRRDSLPLIFCADDLVWVPGVGIDCRYAAQPGEAAVVPQWLPA